MSEEISILQEKTENGWEFQVQVGDDLDQTSHQVTMSEDFYDNLETKVDPKAVIKESFGFLLEREPKEMILPRFDITTISRYFPEFEEKLSERL